MAFILDPQTGKITFGVVADLSHDAIARDIASEFGVSEDFKDDFVTNTNWNTSDVTNGFIDLTNQNLFHNAITDGTNTSVIHDLGIALSDTAWVIRFKLNIDLTIGSSIFDRGWHMGVWGLDETNDCASVDDFLGFVANVDNTAQLYTNGLADDVNVRDNVTGTNFTHVVQNETIYVEMIRESATSFRTNLFSDANYTVLIETQVDTISANINGLQFVGIKNRNFTNSADHILETRIDDIQVWDGITVPVITSSKWRMRFTLDITALSLVSGSDLSMWVSMSDKDETNASTVANDSFQLSVFVDSLATSFAMQTADNQAPRIATTDVVMATVPSVSTFFLEMERDSASQTTVRFYTDNTYQTISETKTQAGISGTDNLKYLKLLNDVLGNNANTMDGTFDDFTFTDMTLTGADINKDFLVDAQLVVLFVTINKDFLVDAIIVNRIDDTFLVDALTQQQNIDEEFLVDALVQSLGDNGCTKAIFFDTINDAIPWTVVGGSQIVVNDTAGVIEWNALQGGGGTTNRRAFRSISSFANNVGRIEMRLKVDKITSVAETGIFMQIQSGTNDPGTPAGLTGGWIQMSMGSGAPAGVFAQMADGTTISGANAIQIPFADGTTRFLQTVFDPIAQTLTIAVYTDSAFTIHAPSSPQVIDTSALTMSGAFTFDTVLCGNFTGSGTGRIITADLDDFTIISGGCPTFQVDASLIFIQDEEFTVDAIIKRLGINGSCEPLLTFTDDFVIDKGWITTDATFMFIGGGQKLIARAIPDNTNDTIALDLDTPARLGGKISDNNFQVRFQIQWGQIGAGNPGNLMFFSVSDSDQTANSGNASEDAIGIRARVGSGADTTNGYFKDSSATFNFTPSLGTISTGLIRFYEIIRTGTTVTWNVYSDAGFTALITSESLTVPSTVTALQYFKVGNRQFANILTTLEADLDNLDIQQGGALVGGVSCVTADAIVKALNTDKIFSIDGIAFIPPAKLFIVQGLIKGTLEEEFFIDACLVNAPIFTFTADACIQQTNNEETFTVDGLAFDFPVRLFLVDSIVRYAQGTTTQGGIPDLIIRVLRENGTLTGIQIVEEINIITSDPAEGFSFVGKTSRIKNWLTRLTLDNLIQEDGSDPDWYETIWSLV